MLQGNDLHHSSQESTTVEETSQELRHAKATEPQPSSPEDVNGTTVPTPSPVPDGGFNAWLQVLGAFMLFFNTWGVLNTFGVYQTYYESGQLYSETSSNISWIGSIQSFTVLLVGALTGSVFDAGHLRLLLSLGAFGIVFGHMMLSLCDEWWQCLLAQGFVIGMGGGCLYVPAVAIMPQYFRARLGLALGLAASGSSMGGIVYPIVLYRLVDPIGFGWTTRVLGFIALATLLIPVACMRMRVRPGKVRALIDWSAFRDVYWILFVAGTSVGFVGVYVGLFYTSYYGQERGITGESLSFYLVPILNAGSVFGRTIPNWVSDKTGPFNIVAPGAFITGVVLLCMMAVDSVGGLVVLTLLFGFFSGIFIALPPVLFNALTEDKSKLGTRIGMGFAFIGLGVLVAGPGGGGILGSREPLDWQSLWTFGGVCTLVGGVVFIGIRVARAGWKLRVKV